MMKAKTRLFGEIEIEDAKVITFEKGIIGFPEYTKFTLIYNKEKENSPLLWLQSMEEADFALLLIDPLKLKETYNPIIHNDAMQLLGEVAAEDLLVFVTLSIPNSEVKKATANLKAPIVINVPERKAVQVIVEDDESVRFPVYEILSGKKVGE